MFIRDIQKDNKIVIKGISNEINRAYILGDGTILNQKNICMEYIGINIRITYIEIPEYNQDPFYTVVALVLDSPIKLYKEQNSGIEFN